MVRVFVIFKSFFCSILPITIRTLEYFFLSQFGRAPIHASRTIIAVPSPDQNMTLNIKTNIQRGRLANSGREESFIFGSRAYTRRLNPKSSNG